MVIKQKGKTYDLSLDRQSVGVSHKAEGEDLASPDPGLEMTPVFLDLDFRPLPRRNAELAILDFNAAFPSPLEESAFWKAFILSLSDAISLGPDIDAGNARPDTCRTLPPSGPSRPGDESKIARFYFSKKKIAPRANVSPSLERVCGGVSGPVAARLLWHCAPARPSFSRFTPHLESTSPFRPPVRFWRREQACGGILSGVQPRLPVSLDIFCACRSKLTPSAPFHALYRPTTSTWTPRPFHKRLSRLRGERQRHRRRHHLRPKRLPARAVPPAPRANGRPRK